MTVAAEKLQRMAEQIADNIVLSDDPLVVGQRLADHLERFWDPRMRQAFVELAQSGAPMGKALTEAARRLEKASPQDAPTAK